MTHMIESSIDISSSKLEILLDLFLVKDERYLNPWESYKPRIFVSALFSLIAAITIFNLAFFISGNKFSYLHSACVIASLISLSGIYWFYRSGGRLTIATQSFMVVNSAILTSFVILTGGFDSPIISLLVLFPFLGILMGARASAIYWTSFSFVVYFSFYFIKSNNIEIPLMLNEEYINITQIVGWITLCFSLVVGLNVYGRANETTTKKLHQESQILTRKTETDSDSGLMNMAGFTKYLSQTNENQSGKYTGLVLLRLNNYEQINAELDRNQMKLFTQAFSRKCLSLAGGRYQVARLNNDDIAFIVENAHSTSDLSVLGNDLVRTFKRGIRFDSNRDKVIASVFCGISMTLNEKNLASNLLENAQFALSLCSQQELCKIFLLKKDEIKS